MTRRRIGIDVRQFYRPMPRGMGKYIERMLLGFADERPDEFEFFLYFERDAPPSRPTFPTGFSERHLRARGSRFEVWERFRLPVALRMDAVELFHGTGNTLPPTQPCPMVVTLHDTLMLEGEGGDEAFARYVRHKMPRALRRARRIITDSQASARDIEERLDYPAERIRVIPLGVEGERFTVEADPRDDEVLASYGLRHDGFLFALGVLGERKNTALLLEAMARLESPPTLVLVGFQEQALAGFREQVAAHGLTDHVQMHGYVPAFHLPALYRHCRAFVFPSKREGFGLPVVEAMSCGAPVISSNRSSMPEITGKHAVLFDPDSVDALADAIRRIDREDELRRSLRESGPARAATFSWERTAMDTLAVYREVFEELDGET